VAWSLVMRVHNPHNYTSGCDADCWCRRNRLGRLVKWWIPARYLAHAGVHHRIRALEEWKRTHPPGALREWKRRQQRA
jgi:hypothetical protein